MFGANKTKTFKYKRSLLTASVFQKIIKPLDINGVLCSQNLRDLTPEAYEFHHMVEYLWNMSPFAPLVIPPSIECLAKRRVKYYSHALKPMKVSEYLYNDSVSWHIHYGKSVHDFRWDLAHSCDGWAVGGHHYMGIKYCMDYPETAKEHVLTLK